MSYRPIQQKLAWQPRIHVNRSQVHFNARHSCSRKKTIHLFDAVSLRYRILHVSHEVKSETASKLQLQSLRLGLISGPWAFPPVWFPWALPDPVWFSCVATACHSWSVPSEVSIPCTAGNWFSPEFSRAKNESNNFRFKWSVWVISRFVAFASPFTSCSDSIAREWPTLHVRRLFGSSFPGSFPCASVCGHLFYFIFWSFFFLLKEFSGGIQIWPPHKDMATGLVEGRGEGDS